jgi:hypothetical protein
MNFAAIRKAAQARGLGLKKCTEDHWQITGGPLLVNLWPSKGTVYVAGTKGSTNGYALHPGDLVALAFTPPPMTGTDRAERNSKMGQKRAWKAKRVRLGQPCWICHKPVKQSTASLDHVVPLARGGLDQPNNWRLSHRACNHARGHAMPEVRA